MNPTWQLIESIYDECLTLSEPERIPFVKSKNIVDKALEKVLIQMLSNSENAIEYFNNFQITLFESLANHSIPQLRSGEYVGNYRIIDLLAKGGMSNVYLAERADGHYDKKVAVKLLSLSLKHTDHYVFRKEEQHIMAKLQHPNIAVLYDAGISDQNIPYFVMEYVEGVPIDKYLASRQLQISDALHLFLKVTEAVSYAHSRLTLHLDLKPGNIFVDNAGEVKLLDFGIATSLTEVQNQFGSFMGTPAIVAPEQIEGKILSVGTDIYQLGCLLHFILCGFFPENDVGDDADPQNISLYRLVTQKKISESIETELAFIIKKCLHNNADQRYASAGDLIQDIKNYMNNFPVLAVPASWQYSSRKFLRRNQTRLIALLIIFLSLSAGITASLWQAGEARRQRDLAVKNEKVAGATTSFLVDLFMTANPAKSKGDTLTVFEFLNLGYEKIDEYSGPPEVKLELLTTMSQLYRSLGNHSRSGEILKNANNFAKDNQLGLSRSFLFLMQQQALYQRDIGRFDSATLLLQKSIELHIAMLLPEVDSFYTASLKYLSYICKSTERFDTALYYIKRAINLEKQLWGENQNLHIAESYFVLGSIYKDKADYEEAIKYLRHSYDICQAMMGDLFPGTISGMNHLAATYKLMGQYDEALPYNQKARQLAERLYGPNHRETATSMDNLGNTFLRLNHYDSALYYFNHGLNIRRQVYPDNNNLYILTSMNNMLSCQLECHFYDSALMYLNQALEIIQSPKINSRQKAYTYRLAGSYFEKTNDLRSAKTYYRHSWEEYMKTLDPQDERLINLSGKILQIDSLYAYRGYK
ncbi:MAG: serine/threonine protein kinase [Cyclobacteriaceae bacterium]|nr:serine/threonine protein kinase [Cyclobacteriaceae bacterium]